MCNAELSSFAGMFLFNPETPESAISECSVFVLSS
jgi:hypothetical protein